MHKGMYFFLQSRITYKRRECLRNRTFLKHSQKTDFYEIVCRDLRCTDQLAHIEIECRRDGGLSGPYYGYLSLPSTFHRRVNRSAVCIALGCCLRAKFHRGHTRHGRHIKTHVHLCVSNRFSCRVGYFYRKRIVAFHERISSRCKCNCQTVCSPLRFVPL